MVNTKLKDKNFLLIISIILVAIIFFSLTLYKINQIKNFYSYDPYIHLLISQDTINTGIIGENISSCVYQTSMQYPSLLRVIAPILSLISGSDMLYFFKFFGPILIFVTAIFIFLSVRAITKSKLAIFSLIFTLFLPYLFWRALITYPENLVLLFYSFSLWAIIRRNKTLFMIGMVSSAFAHLKSFIILGPIFLCYFLFLKKKEDNKKVLLFFIILLLFLFPLFGFITNSFGGYLEKHITWTSKGGTIENLDLNPDRYSPLGIGEIIDKLGVFSIIFGVLGVFFILNKKDKIKYLLLIWLLTFLIALFGNLFGINIPYTRMISYLSLPLIVILGVYVCSEKIIVSRYTYFIIVLVVILSLITNVIQIRGSISITEDEFKSIKELSLIKERIYISNSPILKVLNVRTECDNLKIGSIFESKSREELINKTKSYPDQVYILLTKKDKYLIDKTFLSMLDSSFNKEYENELLEVYYIK